MAEPRRRAADRVDPDVLLAISEGDAENRHLLRNEFAEAIVLFRADLAVIKQDVQTGNLADRTEFAQIQAKQMELTTDVTDLRKWQERIDPRVQALEAGALASKEVTALKRWAVGAAVFPTLSILAGIGLFLAQHY